MKKARKRGQAGRAADISPFEKYLNWKVWRIVSLSKPITLTSSEAGPNLNQSHVSSPESPAQSEASLHSLVRVRLKSCLVELAVSPDLL